MRRRWDGGDESSARRWPMFSKTGPSLDPWRSKLWDTDRRTPQLDWLLLTKRPELVGASTPLVAMDWPSNVWLGTTVENQEAAKTRLAAFGEYTGRSALHFALSRCWDRCRIQPWLRPTIDWVITGGESGPKARPSSPSWFRDLLRPVRSADVPFHFKQWGDWMPGAQ